MQVLDDHQHRLLRGPRPDPSLAGHRFRSAPCSRYHLLVLHTTSLPPRRLSRPVWRSYFAIEAPRGSFERWKLQLGDVVEIKG